MFYDLWKLAIAYVFVLIAVCANYSDPHFTSWSVFFLTLMGVSILIFVAAWLRQSKMIDDWIRLQGDAPIIYVLSEETVETTAQAGSTKLKWDAFAGLRISDFDTLLKFPRAGGALTLRTDQVPSEAIEYLKSRFHAYGKKIEDKRKSG